MPTPTPPADRCPGRAADGAGRRALAALLGTAAVVAVAAAVVVVPASPAPARTGVTVEVRADAAAVARPGPRARRATVAVGGRVVLAGRLPGGVRRPYVVVDGGRTVLRGRTAGTGRFRRVARAGAVPGTRTFVVQARRHRGLGPARRTFHVRVVGSTPTARPTASPTPLPTDGPSGTPAPTAEPTATPGPTDGPTAGPTASTATPGQVPRTPLTLQPTPTAAPTPDQLAHWAVPTVSSRTGQRLVIEGTVTGAVVAGRTVQVQHELEDGWRTLATTTSAADGSYRVALATDWLFRTPARVVVPAAGELAAATSAVVDVASVPGWSPAGTATDWRSLDGDTRWRWDPCTPIGVRLNVGSGPTFLRAATLAALDDVAEGTGLRFALLGDTDVVPWPTDGRPYPADTDLVIAHGPQSLTEQDVSGSVIGVGGVSAGREARDARGAVVRTTEGGVFLDADAQLTYDKAVNLVRHELGHAVGLGHASGRAQVMYPSLQLLDRFGAGDLGGFRSVGRQTGCIEPLARRAMVSALQDGPVPPAPLP
ncbi:matrixin family metalloprotease [Nocardioides solisilvae]|uniref:matrixin family metalloprotease n=1 Tax=Nocardioides solisilvae TaxID=1542435 RepID=UPI000D742EF6|nr:matrixin family metalloprotease [Nocardioides solisilvae]